MKQLAADGIPVAVSPAAAKAARETANEAEHDAATAWSDATQAGWSAGELRKLGLHQPTNRRGGRPKGSRTAKTPVTNVDSAPTRDGIEN